MAGCTSSTNILVEPVLRPKLGDPVVANGLEFRTYDCESRACYRDTNQKYFVTISVYGGSILVTSSKEFIEKDFIDEMIKSEPLINTRNTKRVKSGIFTFQNAFQKSDILNVTKFCLVETYSHLFQITITKTNTKYNSDTESELQKIEYGFTEFVKSL